MTLPFFGGKFEGAEDSKEVGREMLRLTQEIWWENIQNGKINKKTCIVCCMILWRKNTKKYRKITIAEY